MGFTIDNEEVRWDVRQQELALKGANNVMYTQGLFYEFGDKGAIYTLKSDDVIRDGVKYVSIYKVFMESSDEYEAAMRITGSMAHWRKLCSLTWFTDGIDIHSWEGINQARIDMQMRDKSEAKKKLLEAVQAGNVTAMRTLYGESAPKRQTTSKRKLSSVDSTVNASILDDLRRVKEAR